MRLKEPFRGLYLMGGHTIFHFALLFASMIVLGFVTPNKGEAVTKKEKALEDSILVINQLRIAHGLNIFFSIIKFLGSAP